ncbi:hypothetical protein CPC08DRAFT_332645 [Agrocybe pediades]|nr:hypothetical protein CPC08DRAFT_332645 [Agrocybe pediades]
MQELIVSTCEVENLTNSVAISAVAMSTTTRKGGSKPQYYIGIVKSSTKVLCTATRRGLSLPGLLARHRYGTNTALRTCRKLDLRG